MTLRTRVLLVAATAFTLASAPAAAAPLDEAKAAFNAGKAAFEAGDFPTALAEFQRANQLVPAPNLDYNIGKTFEALGRYRDAAVAFERYIETKGPPDGDEEQKFQDELRRRIVADRSRAAVNRPQPQAPPTYPPAEPQYRQYPPNYYRQPYPYPYQVAPQTGWQPTRNDMIYEAQGRRRRAIALMVVGLALDVIGLALAIDGFHNPHDYGDYNWANYTEDVIGVSLIVTGIPLWASGASSYVRATRRLGELGPPDPAAAAPAAALFNLASIRF